jgi:nicotinamide-nucleotide amidase
MHAEIVVTGSEILLGKLVDTNSAYLAGRLQDVGIPVHYISAVGDDEARVAATLRAALARATLVITTGGLGPTVDDVTREAVAAATGRPLGLDERLLAQIAEFFERIGRTMTENNRRQAYLPAGALALENPVGTAPAFIVEAEGATLISLPGVPREMKYLMEQSVLPYLRRRFGGNQIIRSRTLHTASLGESLLDSRLGDELLRCTNPSVGLNARAGQVDVRLTATAPDEAACEALIAPLEARVRERLGSAVYGADEDTLERVVLAGLAARGQTLATAEAGTRGQLAGRLASAAGSAAIFRSGRVASLVASLAAELELALAPATSGDTLAEVRALAERLRAATAADYALVVSVSPEPVELAWALAGPGRLESLGRPFRQSAEYAGDWASVMALDTLRRRLAGAEAP